MHWFLHSSASLHAILRIMIFIFSSIHTPSNSISFFFWQSIYTIHSQQHSYIKYIMIMERTTNANFLSTFFLPYKELEGVSIYLAVKDHQELKFLILHLCYICMYLTTRILLAGCRSASIHRVEWRINVIFNQFHSFVL